MKNRIITLPVLLIALFTVMSCAVARWKVAIISVDEHPRLTISNQTGYPIRLSSPDNVNLNHTASTVFHFGEFYERNAIINVEYFINDYKFSQQVYINQDMTVILTERPPELTVRNNVLDDRYYPITITAPFQQVVNPSGISSPYPKQSREINPKHIVTYMCGQFSYNIEGMLNEDDVTYIATERPPILTIQNNTGHTINIVHIRNHDASDWGDENLLTIRLDEHGARIVSGAETTGVERRGSFLHNESYRVWFGHIRDIRQYPDRYDIRVDDVNSVAYVKRNVQINSDMNLTFSQADRVR